MPQRKPALSELSRRALNSDWLSGGIATPGSSQPGFNDSGLSLVTFNGTQLAEHQGGHLPFSYELTNYLVSGDNVLAISLDSTWQNVPPDGNSGGGSAQRNHSVWLFCTSVPVTAGKTVAAATLPAGGGVQNGRATGGHEFALGIG